MNFNIGINSEIKIIDYFGGDAWGECITIDGELVASYSEFYDEEQYNAWEEEHGDDDDYEEYRSNIFLLYIHDDEHEEPEEFDSEEAAKARLQELYDDFLTIREAKRESERVEYENKKKNFLASWNDSMYDTLASVAADFCVTVDVLKRHVENNLNSIIDSYSNWNEYIDREGFYGI